MMYENRVSVKKFGGTPKDMTWWEFYQTTLDIFGASAAGTKTWQNYFGTEEEIPEKTESEKQPGQVELKEDAPFEPEERVPEESAEPQEHSQPQEKMTGTADENVVEQEEPEPFEDEKEPEENRQSENVEEPVKTEIAPAQKSEETQENQGMDEPASEDREAENEPLEVEKVEAEVVEAPYETRKEYMDSLSTYELAGYLADEYRIQCKKEMDLGYQEKVYEWLKQKVDRCGKAVDENEKD